MDNPRNVPVDESVLGIEPLSARSLILSVLLGSHPPELPGRALVALAELFSIRPGTTRTALSRMTANGELAADDGRYRLAGRLLERQRQQDDGRSEPDAAWDGSWIVAITVADRRTMAERRAFRSSMVGSRMAELRPDIWLRPGNVASPPRSPDVLITRGPLDADDLHDLIGRLWPLDDLDAQARRLRNALAEHGPLLDRDGLDVLPSAFLLSAAAVRFLRTEPQLPTELQPAGWAPPALRPQYDEFEQTFQLQLRRFFASLS